VTQIIHDSSLQEAFIELRKQLEQRIIGQAVLVRRLLIALLADGHLLVEGAPGLAKTTAIKQLAAHIVADFHRIQFTPDLLPADITGTEIFRPQEGTFKFQRGPIFHNLLLADEINRAPAKVQAALLEAMAERQVSYGSATYGLPDLFLVMATQNPIEQEGTYPLPEAQLDRFLMYVRITYPDMDAEQKILQISRDEEQGVQTPSHLITQEQIKNARKACRNVYLSPDLEQYLIQLVMATRAPQIYQEQLASWIRFGASPRATIALDRCSKAHAWLQGRDFVTPDDIQAVAYDILRHRILLTFTAEAEGITTDDCIREILQWVAVP
jgi:MoxR-like ATPase